MSSGGITGYPKVINGRTGGTPGPVTSGTPINVEIKSPRKSTRGSFARSLRIKNLDGTNNLFVRINGDSEVFSVTPGAELQFEGIFHRLVIDASAGTVQWEALAVVS